MESNLKEKLTKAAKEMRVDILKMSLRCGAMGAHMGGSLSAVDILAVLYLEFMRPGQNGRDFDQRDRFIMSKAHSVMAQYAALKQAGLITQDEIDHAMVHNDLLFKHPKMNLQKGIEFSGGSLGQGLPLGVGTAIALKRKGYDQSRVYVMVGDGECDEGSIWEAAALAGHRKLSNLTVIVDQNCLQNDGKTQEIIDKSRMARRWEAFGFEVVPADGHDVESIYEALSHKSQKPIAVIAKTTKGKGVSFAENVVDWHAAYLTQELYDQAMAEQEDGQ